MTPTEIARKLPLGFGAAIGKAISGRRQDPGIERVLIALMASRTINPSSKRDSLGWAGHDVLLPGAGGLGGCQMCCMSVLA